MKKTLFVSLLLVLTLSFSAFAFEGTTALGYNFAEKNATFELGASHKVFPFLLLGGGLITTHDTTADTAADILRPADVDYNLYTQLVYKDWALRLTNYNTHLLFKKDETEKSFYTLKLIYTF